MEHPYETSTGLAANGESSMQTMLPSVSRFLRTDVLVLLLIFAVFHYFKLTNFFIAIDDDFEAFRSDGYNWILAGRWASYLFLRFLVPQPILPFFPTLIFGIGLVVSYPILLSCFGVKRLAPVHYLAFALYAGFPTWVYLTSLTTASCWAGVGQLFVVLAIARYRRVLDLLDSGAPEHRARVVANSLLSVAAYAVALGFYQAFFTPYVVLGLSVLLVLHQHSPTPFWRLVRRVLLLSALTVAALILNALIDAAFRKGFGLLDTHYLTAFLNLRALIDSPLIVIGQTLRSLGDVYAGLAPIYAADCLTFPIIIVSGLAGIAFGGGNTLQHRLFSFALAAGILAFPFVQHLLNGGEMPYRTLVAIPSIYWLFAMLGLTSRVRAVALISFFATAIALIQITYASNFYFTAGHFARIQDQELASAVYTRVVDLHPDFDMQKTYYVDFFGARPFVTRYPRPPSTTAGASFFEWDGGNEERILNFMSVIGYTNLRTPPIEQRRQDLAAFAQMPTWPARDSVKIVGDVTLVKLGATAGFPFNVP